MKKCGKNKWEKGEKSGFGKRDQSSIKNEQSIDEAQSIFWASEVNSQSKILKIFYNCERT